MRWHFSHLLKDFAILSHTKRLRLYSTRQQEKVCCWLLMGARKGVSALTELQRKGACRGRQHLPASSTVPARRGTPRGTRPGPGPEVRAELAGEAGHTPGICPERDVMIFPEDAWAVPTRSASSAAEGCLRRAVELRLHTSAHTLSLRASAPPGTPRGSPTPEGPRGRAVTPHPSGKDSPPGKGRTLRLGTEAAARARVPSGSAGRAPRLRSRSRRLGGFSGNSYP